MARYAVVLGLLGLALLGHTATSSPLSWVDKLEILSGKEPVEFEDARFYYASMPRAVLALLAGAALGLAGTILQQATRNRLVSPLTLGVSSGAWLGLLAATVWMPGLAAGYGEWYSLAGAVLSLSLVILIAGRNGVGGLPVILAGMAVNMLLGALGTTIVLFKSQYVQHVFIWGAGDLTQTDWSKAAWLAPRLALALPVVAFAARPLTLMRLGEQGASARGLALWPFMLTLVLASLWMTANVITAVGIIGFIGLLAPNLARLAGTRKVGDELTMSLVLGAALLLATDAIALFASQWTRDLVPSGASAALIGAPALIWLSASRMRAKDHASLVMPEGIARIGPAGIATLVAAPIALVLLSATFGPVAEGWRLAWPSDLVWSLRWPRIITAAAAGAGVATAGVILQRLIRNPLASPDILGMTSGATLALVGAAIFAGGSIYEIGAPVALTGSFAVLVFLLLVGRRHDYAPGLMALIGISLAALLDALVQFMLARGGDAAFSVLGWMAGSTYRAKPTDAAFLAAAAMVAVGLAAASHRWLTLINAGDVIAAGRGLSVSLVRPLFLVLAAAITAAVTAVMGPVAFVGLLAPHMAAMLGARTALKQLSAAALFGAAIMIMADWLGRSLLYPLQMPAGTVASIIGGGYFIFLLARRRPV
jgi:ABC-type Fe3+-siderophore transport system permease subunit